MFPLEIRQLVKSYANTTAVNHVSFHLDDGEMFALLGPNGAGKTSIISCISTLEKPTEGQVLIFGTDVAMGSKETKQLLGVVPQEVVSHGFFSVEEVLKFHSGYYGLLNNQKQIDFLLDRLALKAHKDKRVRQLSGGMKRRLAIAKALVHKPKLLLLDEPTAGVDVELRNTLWEFVEELNHDQKVTVLLTTHYLEEAEKLCKRVGVLHQGKILEVGQTKDLIQKLTLREIKIILKNPIPKLQTEYLKKQTDTEVSFRIPNTLEIGNILSLVGVDQIMDLKIREGKLEDAFLRLVESE